MNGDRGPYNFFYGRVGGSGGRVAWLKLEIRLSQPQLNWIELNWNWIEAELGNFLLHEAYIERVVGK